MKETLDQESRISLSNYRMARASESIEEAKLLASEGHYNAAINRLYYACYYAVVALEILDGIQTQTHAGVKTQFNLHYIAPGILPIAIGKVFSTLFEKRHSGDYDDFVFCDQETVDSLLPGAEDLISSIKKLILEKNE